jgi:hypothetical protein
MYPLGRTMKKEISTTLACAIIALLIGGIGLYYVWFMRQKVKYTIVPEPMVGPVNGGGKRGKRPSPPRSVDRKAAPAEASSSSSKK